MPEQNELPVTQRAYTLRLRGTDPSDNSWREALWKTHETVNKGAKVFGDWLLTLRGGLNHALAEENGGNSSDSTGEKRRSRRILLALSWLSVESKLGAPEKYIVAYGDDTAEERKKKVICAFEEILKSKNLTDEEIEEWKSDCKDSLSAAIREDAVWVNRSKAFDDVAQKHSITSEDIWDMLALFFGSSEKYLAPEIISEDESEAEIGANQRERVKDFVEKAGQWLSWRFGTGEGADFNKMVCVYEKIAEWAADSNQTGLTGKDTIKNLAIALNKFSPKSEDLKGILGLISGPGYKSGTRKFLKILYTKSSISSQELSDLSSKAKTDAQNCRDKVGQKGQRCYADIVLNEVESDCGFTYRTDKDGQDVPVSDYSKYDDDYNWGTSRHKELAVILDHAVRRVSLAHTWVKKAEAKRSKFEEDAEKIKQVPENIKNWLDRFCLERLESSGALDTYYIRKRAVSGWREVVKAWSKPDCKTKEDRIAAARELQDSPDIEKFGDIQLFEALADEEALCVWHKDGDIAKSPDPQPLIDYSLAQEAQYNKQRFKVPSYRHPDSLLHPVFCDFGESRWEIKFDVHQKAANAGRTRNRNTSLNDFNLHGLSMNLWTGEKIKPIRLLWQSKRMSRDLLRELDEENDSVPGVTRADRLGLAASNVNSRDVVKIANIFSEKTWNGRLQAPRQQLEAIAKHVEKYGWDEKACKMRDRIKWLISFSPRLQPKGPWIDYASTFSDDNPARPFASKRGVYAVKYKDNDKRKGYAKLILSRLPRLRVLSVDLGHRYAAACAVWETLSAEQMEEACRNAGHEKPKETDLYLHLKRKTGKHKEGKDIEVEQTTIYRRIGADKLPDGSLHPAPWARLDRQFLIKLQGEKEGAREASNNEIWKVHSLENELGRSMPLIDRLVATGWGATERQAKRLEELKRLGWKPDKENYSENNETSVDLEEDSYCKPSISVDELMFSAVSTMRLALKRHGDRARIAHYLITDERTKPGGKKEKLDEKGRVELLKDALVIWRDLFSSPNWRDREAKELWDSYIVKLPSYRSLEETAEESSTTKSRRREKLKEKMQGIAEELAKKELLRKELYEIWKKRWEADDEKWKKQIRSFKDWILPKGIDADNPSIWKVGGLSLTRLATLTEFRRKVQVGFFTRLHPDGSRTEIKENFGQKTLNALENMREQRVKQTASRIVEAALGIGSEAEEHWEKGKRPRQRIGDPRFAPCHAIVIENLERYRPEETRTRRENRQLMNWSSSKLKDYLSEACQLYGLSLREVSASYTSRQDSRTGAPGVRCQDVPVYEFMKSSFWRKQVSQAEAKLNEDKGDTRERFLCDLNAIWKDKTIADWKKAGFVRIPLNGGEIFVSADKNSPASKGIQADLNAAANIGLKALTDPDWEGKWWYVPCNSESYKPDEEKIGGSAAINPKIALLQRAEENIGERSVNNRSRRQGKSKSENKGVVNLWRDISSLPLTEGEWKEYSAYKNGVMYRVVDILKGQTKGYNQ